MFLLDAELEAQRPEELDELVVVCGLAQRGHFDPEDQSSLDRHRLAAGCYNRLRRIALTCPYNFWSGHCNLAAWMS
jgi:hypothetical protein